MSAKLKVTGQIQGVGYRKFVKQQAKKLGLFGWVQNMPDGSVEAEVFGPTDAVHTFISRCRKGTFLSKVKNIEVSWFEEEIVPSDFIIISSQ